MATSMMFIEVDFMFSFSYRTSYPQATLKISKELPGKSTVVSCLCNIVKFLTRKDSTADVEYSQIPQKSFFSGDHRTAASFANILFVKVPIMYNNF